jgi:hypothetical protein
MRAAARGLGADLVAGVKHELRALPARLRDGERPLLLASAFLRRDDGRVVGGLACVTDRRVLVLRERPGTAMLAEQPLVAVDAVAVRRSGLTRATIELVGTPMTVDVRAAQAVAVAAVIEEARTARRP